MSNEEELGLPLGTGSLVLGYSTVSPRSHPPASLSSIIHGQSIDYLLSSPQYVPTFCITLQQIGVNPRNLLLHRNYWKPMAWKYTGVSTSELQGWPKATKHPIPLSNRLQLKICFLENFRRDLCALSEVLGYMIPSLPTKFTLGTQLILV